MSVVGQFPLMNMHRRIIRAPINPIDKSTIVSVFPRELDEKKWTIQPGRFVVPAGTPEKPGILVVGPSSWWREIDEDQPLLEIPVSSIQVADSVVKDYVNGVFGFNGDAAGPGLFYIPGTVTVEQIKTEYKGAFEKAIAKQKNWYTLLLKAADSLWARSNGNPLAISDDMRLAAKELGVQATKDWMKDFQMVEMVRCAACGALKNPEFPVCASCRNVDMNHPASKNLKFAAQ